MRLLGVFPIWTANTGEVFPEARLTGANAGWVFRAPRKLRRLPGFQPCLSLPDW